VHSIYCQQIEEGADIKKSYLWLEKFDLKDSMEALIVVPQAQALSTRAIEARVYYTS